MKNFLGENIKSYRKILGLSQDKLAEKVGISTHSIKMIEANNQTPSLDNYLKICEALKVPSDILLADSSKQFKLAAIASLIDEFSKLPDEDIDKLFLLSQKIHEYKQKVGNNEN